MRKYLKHFDADVTAYLSTMPSLDTNVVLGLLPSPLNPSASHEIVSDAMRLDPSAKNGMPPSACIWLGARIVPLSEAIGGITNPKQVVNDGVLLGLAPSPPPPPQEDPVFIQQKRLLEQSMFVELDLLTKYPILCETRSQDEHYGAAGGKPMDPARHWEDSFDRRLGRIDKLTIAWRDSMLNEWASSLYGSRQTRYAARLQVVKQCMGVYHKQYIALKDSIVEERANLLARYDSLDLELVEIMREEK